MAEKEKNQNAAITRSSDLTERLQQDLERAVAGSLNEVKGCYKKEWAKIPPQSSETPNKLRQKIITWCY